MLNESKLLLALNVGFLFLAVDCRRATLDAADHAGMELAVAHLLYNTATLYFTRESIQKRLP